SVEMVEHILAALFGLGVDNCEVGVTASEMPGCDGSALAFVEAIADAGIQQQALPVQPLVVTEPVRCEDGGKWIEARPPIGEELSVEYNLDYGADSSIAPQWAVAEITPMAFATELAPARTFLLEAEAEAIRAQGLAKHVTAQDLLIFGQDGPIDNQLRYPDECARHKALDVVGDLALAGRPIVGHVVACRSGHRLNADLVRKLLASHPQQSGSPGQSDLDQTRRRSA
ncbi:MAG: UDP-3-O-acyl-N-acetylglucosamine deacetylase, partial [Planctomycetota bacterium]